MIYQFISIYRNKTSQLVSNAEEQSASSVALMTVKKKNMVAYGAR